jgi:membrane protein implicated in regulation of membrane protease activity
MADPLRAHPYYWLGYVAVGDQTPLYNTKMPYFIVLIVLLLAIFFTERYLSVRKKQKSIKFQSN